MVKKQTALTVVEKCPMGRPSSYSLELGDEIVRRIALGELLDQIAKEPGMPSRRTIYSWRLKHPEFADLFRIAQECRAEQMLDEVVRLADEIMETDSAVKVNAARLKADSLKWAASKLAPKRFGDKLELTSSDELAERISRARERVTKRGDTSPARSK